MKTFRQQHGVTLIELLIVVAILSLVMAGIYGLLNAAYQAYMDSRRRMESQQTARVVLDYITFRLREIDGGRNTDTPWKCTDCHTVGRATGDQTSKDNIPCPEDVSIPRKILSINTLKLDSLTALDYATLKIPNTMKMTSANTQANNISFVADLLPTYGFSESFTDAPEGQSTHNGVWDWTKNDKAKGDLNLNGLYDDGEFELLEDLNENSQLDVYNEDWNLRLILDKNPDGTNKPFYTLVESMSFTVSASPKTTRADSTCPSGKKLLYNRSPYCDEGYSPSASADKNYAEIATGIVRLNIRAVPRYGTTIDLSASGDAAAAAAKIGTQVVSKRCQDPSNVNACHGSSASGNLNVYASAAQFNLQRFVATHEYWNVRGFVVEVTAGASKGGTTRLTTLQQFVIPRNMEINR